MNMQQMEYEQAIRLLQAEVNRLHSHVKMLVEAVDGRQRDGSEKEGRMDLDGMCTEHVRTKYE